jgi:GNAT superfamily N-acetyltransferase
VPWPQAQKDAFLHQPFRLQHHHFVTHFAAADFWVADQFLLPSGAKAPVGRFYLDRSTPVWHVIDVGFVPEARGQGLGSVLLQWRQAAAIDAGLTAIDLQVAVTNKRAEKLYRALGFKADGNAEGFYQRMVIAQPVRISKRLSRISCKFVTGL